MSAAPILAVEALSKRFRGLQAMSDVSFTVEPGSITSVIGPNGAGKSTLFNLVTGYLAPTAGTVLFKGQPITGLALAMQSGLDPTASWLVATYALYVLAFVCWVPVVMLQIRARDLAAQAVTTGQPLPSDYYSAMRVWFVLGWPAFTALIVIYLLMVAKPDLW